jgi:hypothetical protein
MEEQSFFDTSVKFQRSARRYIPEERTLHNDSCENIIVFIMKFLLATERLTARRLAGTDAPRCLSRLGLDHKKGKYLGPNPAPSNGRCFLFLQYRLANLTFQQFCWSPKVLKTSSQTAD